MEKDSQIEEEKEVLETLENFPSNNRLYHSNSFSLSLVSSFDCQGEHTDEWAQVQ